MRETFTLKVADKEIVLHSYMTGGEQIDLEAVAIDAGVESVDGRSGQIKMRAEDAYRKRLRKLIDIMVVSIAGETDKEKNWSTLKDMKSKDYDFIMAGIERAAAGLSQPEEKK